MSFAALQRISEQFRRAFVFTPSNMGERVLTSSQSELETIKTLQASKAEGGDSKMVRAAIARAQDGDPEALHFLFIRYADDVRRYVGHLVRDRHEAEDITQNVFVKLMRVIGKYEPREAPFSAWIRRVARNVAFDHLRTRRMMLFEDIHVADDNRGQISRERNHDLREALERLTAEQREVLVLRHIVGLSPSEIAGLLGKTENAIHGLHHRGRLSLRSALLELGAAPVVALS